jgi:outer membrane receptor protein involved in Fe transport
MNLSDRYAHYSPQGAANAYNISAEWAPVAALRVRSSLSRAIRAPNGHELFLTQTLSQFPMADPCTNDPVTGLPAASLAACQRTGVTAAQYGKIPAASAFNQVTGGNPGLKPQTANTLTAGAVLTAGSSLILSADYWRIRVKHYIGSIAAGDTLTNCLNTGDPLYCVLIHRDANGSLSVGNGPAAGRVIATGLNTGSFGMSGVDIEGRYLLPLRSFGLTHGGMVSFVFTGSVAVDNPIEVVPGRAPFDCTGFYGPTCTGEGPTSPIPRWRHKLRATWQADKRLEFSLNWRHIGHMTSEHASSSPHLAGTVYPVDARVGSYDYFDLDTGIDLTSSFALRLGANNLFDRKPPVIGYNANPLLVNGNMLATMYDLLGRYLFLSLRAQF